MRICGGSEKRDAGKWSVRATNELLEEPDETFKFNLPVNIYTLLGLIRPATSTNYVVG